VNFPKFWLLTSGWTSSETQPDVSELKCSRFFHHRQLPTQDLSTPGPEQKNKKIKIFKKFRRERGSRDTLAGLLRAVVYPLLSLREVAWGESLSLGLVSFTEFSDGKCTGW